LEEKFGVEIMGAGRIIVFSKRNGRERVEEKCFSFGLSQIKVTIDEDSGVGMKLQ